MIEYFNLYALCYNAYFFVITLFITKPSEKKTFCLQTMPVFHTGEAFRPQLIELAQGETSAPPLLTEADLIALMDRHGIGTDATHAEHIEKIKSRLYVGVKEDGRFLPGELGMGLVEGKGGQEMRWMIK